ncbi:hypothetical protein HPB49_024809 [Dermacentor silvarum]|uniref:Uncharacterized protein n=1 Tax=Dermacentor silvarum TaxID=543639 RepID=A0ACB8D106_DERSI|nr:hypothetical protein HPB49_024809 [Dermacentor silvarum]
MFLFSEWPLPYEGAEAYYPVEDVAPVIRPVPWASSFILFHPPPISSLGATLTPLTHFGANPRPENPAAFSIVLPGNATSPFLIVLAPLLERALSHNAPRHPTSLSLRAPFPFTGSHSIDWQAFCTNLLSVSFQSYDDWMSCISTAVSSSSCRVRSRHPIPDPDPHFLRLWRRRKRLQCSFRSQPQNAQLSSPIAALRAEIVTQGASLEHARWTKALTQEIPSDVFDKLTSLYLPPPLTPSYPAYSGDPNPGLERPLTLRELKAALASNATRFQIHALVTVDVRKAFDGVCHDYILSQLSSLGCGNRLYFYLRSFLSNPVARFRVNTHLSDPDVLTHGTPQAKIPDLHHIFYADDITLWCSSGSPGHVQDTLQRGIDLIGSFLTTAGLSPAPEKSELLLLNHSSYQPSNNALVCLHLSGSPIPIVPQCKVLGFPLHAAKNVQALHHAVTTCHSVTHLLRHAHACRVAHALALNKFLYFVPYVSFTNTQLNTLETALVGQFSTSMAALNLPITTSTAKLFATSLSHHLRTLLFLHRDSQLARLSLTRQASEDTIKEVYLQSLRCTIKEVYLQLRLDKRLYPPPHPSLTVPEDRPLRRIQMNALLTPSRLFLCRYPFDPSCRNCPSTYADLSHCLLYGPVAQQSDSITISITTWLVWLGAKGEKEQRRLAAQAPGAGRRREAHSDEARTSAEAAQVKTRMAWAAIESYKRGLMNTQHELPSSTSRQRISRGRLRIARKRRTQQSSGGDTGCEKRELYRLYMAAGKVSP